MPKKPLRQIAQLSGLGLQLAITVFVGAYIGRWLDDNHPISEKRIYTLLFTLSFTGLALYNIIKQLNKINKD